MLIKDTDTLRKYANISGTLNFYSAEPTLRAVERKYIVTNIGRTLYEALESAIRAVTLEEPLHPDWIDLLDRCRMVIGPMICFMYGDVADVKLSDAGMQRSETATNKTAFQEQRSKFKEANLLLGEQALEDLFTFLQEKMIAYPEWAESKEFKISTSLFIQSADEFDECYRSPTPYRNYMAMRQYMTGIEEINIKPFLGEELFTGLKEKSTSDFTGEENELLQKIKKAIAFLTIGFAAPLLQARIGSNGITIPAPANFNGNDNDNTRAGITDKFYSSFVNRCNESATAWLTEAHNFITKNKTLFPTWIGFVNPSCEPSESHNNDDLNTVFGL